MSIVEAETYKCPSCSEKDYIFAFENGSKVCLCCCYDGSMSENFIALTGS